MKLLKKITILLCFLSLIAFVSCSAEDKSGVKEKDNTEEGNFYPPFGDYKGKIGYSTSSGEDLNITKVSKVSENTTKIKGYAANSSDGGAKRFDFNISKWKKTIKDGKDIKSEAVTIVVEPGSDLTDISIVYYYDSSTLEITFKINYGNDYLFKGTKQP